MPVRPKYQVFISSTYGDLRVEREAVTWALLTARHIPVGMEAFTATDDRGWQTIKSAIDRSDYYILLVAGRYGSTDEDGLSWTQKEYNYATSKGIPTLVFIRSKSSITADHLEEAPEPRQKLEAFKELLRKKHLCVEWIARNDLVSHVTNALRNHILDDEDSGTPRPGWYRGDEIPASATLDEFARLSSEVSRLQNELNSLRTSLDRTPSLALADRSKLPVSGNHKIERPFKVYHPALTTLQETIATSYGGDYLALNAFVILEPAITNIGVSLVEHVVIDLKFESILGFKCGLWHGSDLLQKAGRLSSSTIKPEYKSQYPESAYLDGPDAVSLRFRLDRVAIGATEYLPPILLVGVATGDSTVSFALSYAIAGSIGSPITGRCLYELAFVSSVLADKKAKHKDEAAVSRLIDHVIWSSVFLRS